MSHWYALYCKPQNEPMVDQQLTLAGVESFCPRYRQAARWRPLFPGYVFARFEPAQLDPRLFRWLPGLLHVVAFDGRPASIPDELIGGIRDRLAAVSAAGAPELLNVRRGEPVRILAGPFKDLEAVFDATLDGKARVRVLLDILGRLSRVDLPATAVARLKPGESAAQSERTRRTRGRGRPLLRG